MLKSGMESQVIKGFAISLFVLASSFALAQGGAGKVLTASGTVTAKISGKQRSLLQGDTIFVNDQVVTNDKSFVVLQFVDGTKVTLLSDSAMLVEDYRYTKTAQDGATLRLESGGLRIVAGAMAKSSPEGFKVRTPVALMVVRGPEFDVTLCGDQICTQDETPY